jgi:hypothetical protein
VSPGFAGAGVGGRLSAFQTGRVKRRGLFARDSVRLNEFGRRRRRGPLALEGLQRPGRVKSWRSPDKHNHLFKLDGVKLRRDVIHARFVQQQDGRDHILANPFGGSPTNVLRMQLQAKATRHGAEDISFFEQSPFP